MDARSRGLNKLAYDWRGLCPAVAGIIHRAHISSNELLKYVGVSTKAYSCGYIKRPR